jgi:hypothetical protein
MHMSWWFDNSKENRWNPDAAADVVYGPETTDEMANARIYYAPVTPRGIVVGDPIPVDVLERARQEDASRRANTTLLDPASNDFSWLTEESR